MELPIFPHEFSAKNTSDKECLNRTMKFRCPRCKRFQDLSFQSQRREMMRLDHRRDNKLPAEEKLGVDVLSPVYLFSSAWLYSVFGLIFFHVPLLAFSCSSLVWNIF